MLHEKSYNYLMVGDRHMAKQKGIVMGIAISIMLIITAVILFLYSSSGVISPATGHKEVKQIHTTTLDNKGRILETTTKQKNLTVRSWRGQSYVSHLTPEQINNITEVERDIYEGYAIHNHELPSTQNDKQGLQFMESFIKQLVEWQGENYDTHINNIRPFLSERGIQTLNEEYLVKQQRYVYANKKVWFIDSVMHTNTSYFYQEFKEYEGVVGKIYGLAEVKRANGLSINSNVRYAYLVLAKRYGNEWKIDYFEPVYYDE